MKKLALTAAFTALAGPALAHTGHGAGGAVSGLLHPLGGADHLLAMLAVGLWSGFVLAHRVWRGAAVFMAAMALGALAAWSGLTLPGLEAGILGSVVLFGLLTLAARPGQGRAVTAASLAAIGGFALFHGQAHALEATGSALPYLAGVLAATGALHLAGIGLARTISGRLAVQQALGVGIALSGVALAMT
ncbi:urease accessory protein [Rhodovulum imhoffii]|uniref:Urease accessory protein n=1 Tax=Rhodovulum imhoffii TaxID=365340 RepID=A0A2T5BS79_9RHOB|nr:HupE/UreJ family protein [Rhodovulum imhoffii]MBK5934740.1 urease accessory protein UreJ [Rhodovulum imhoffii]PTN02164.1 urease accessory protein [Rhodovulum imhoffii]